MLRTLIATLALSLAMSPALANCDGADLRETLTASEDAALAESVQARAYPTGNHWRATRDGEVLHLIGTMHLADPRFDAVVADLEPVVISATRLLLEMTQTEEAALEQELARAPDMIVLSESSLPELMEESEWALVAEEMTARGMPPFMTAKLRPWYVSLLLAIPSCMPLDEAARNGLDARLEAIAEDADVPTQALEPFDTAFRAFQTAPIDMQINMLRASLLGPDVGEDLFETMGNSYFDEEHAEGWALAQVLGPRLSPLEVAENDEIFALMERELLVERNRAWIPVILAALAETDGPIVAAFGAAHLGGNDGVLALLEAEGFALERLPF